MNEEVDLVRGLVEPKPLACHRGAGSQIDIESLRFFVPGGSKAAVLPGFMVMLRARQNPTRAPPQTKPFRASVVETAVQDRPDN
jgi:hypothetical protein